MKCSYTLSGLKKKKTYYIKVRGYTLKKGKRLYGKWSTVKKVKVKKVNLKRGTKVLTL